MLPQSPVNAAARLAIGSADPGTWVALAGYVVAGVVAYALIRRATQWSTPA